MLYPPQLDLDQAPHDDFSSARFKADLRRLLNRLLGRRNDLLTLDSIVDAASIQSQHTVGVSIVPINQIVGSTGRVEDFDRAFYPRRNVTEEKWVSVNRASREGVTLPPVELQKVGEQYFVVDGHHRISVARQRGQQYVDAHVIETIITRRI